MAYTMVMGGLSVAVSLVAAVIVYAAAPRARANRLLAVLLLVEAMGMAAAFFGFQFSRTFAAGSEGVRDLALALLPGLYLAFVGAAIDRPSAAWLSSRAGSIVLVTGTAALAAAALWLVGDSFAWRIGLLALIAATSGYGLIVSLLARRAATDAAARDAYWLFAIGLFAVVAAIGGAGPFRVFERIMDAIDGPLRILFIVLLMFAMLQGRLFGVQRRFAVTTARALVAAFTVIVLVVAIESVEGWFAQAAQALTIVVAVLLALLFRPLERRVEGWTMRWFAVPIDDKEAYLVAVERALDDGHISKDEQRVLDAMARRMEGQGR